MCINMTVIWIKFKNNNLSFNSLKKKKIPENTGKILLDLFVCVTLNVSVIIKKNIFLLLCLNFISVYAYRIENHLVWNTVEPH